MVDVFIARDSVQFVLSVLTCFGWSGLLQRTEPRTKSLRVTYKQSIESNNTSRAANKLGPPFQGAPRSHVRDRFTRSATDARSFKRKPY